MGYKYRGHNASPQNRAGRMVAVQSVRRDRLVSRHDGGRTGPGNPSTAPSPRIPTRRINVAQGPRFLPGQSHFNVLQLRRYVSRSLCRQLGPPDGWYSQQY